MLVGGQWGRGWNPGPDLSPLFRQSDVFGEWSTVDLPDLNGGSRVVGVSHGVEGDSDPAAWVFTATEVGLIRDDGVRLSSMQMFQRSGGSAQWELRESFGIDGTVQSISARQGRWVASIEERPSAGAATSHRVFLTARPGEGESQRVTVAEDEFVESYAAFDDGLLAIVGRLQSPGGEDPATPPRPELRRWKDGAGWETLDVDLGNTIGGAPARLIDAGSRGLYVSFGSVLYRAGEDLTDWEIAAEGRAVVGVLSPDFAPETTPAVAGAGFMVVDTIVGSAENVWLSVDGQLWRQHDLNVDFRGAQLLHITEGTAHVVGRSNGVTGVLQIDIGLPDVDQPVQLQPDVFSRPLVDGAWAQPVYTAANLDGDGFVGLTNTGTEVVFLESASGEQVTRQTSTDFPIEYFANDIDTTEAGYHVIARSSNSEDAVLTSSDGVSWERFDIDIPEGAGSFVIEMFDRSATTAALVGSVETGGDGGQLEQTVLWWDSAGVQHLVPARPCVDQDPEVAKRCRTLSVVATSSGITAESTDETFGVSAGGPITTGYVFISTWTVTSGWTTRAGIGRPLKLQGGLRSGERGIWMIEIGRISLSEDGGEQWRSEIRTPRGLRGSFLGISATGETAVFETQRGLWLYVSETWSEFSHADVDVEAVLALDDDTALLSGQDESGPVVIRLVAPAQ